MNMKKILMVLITLALVCTMAGAVSAELTGDETAMKTQDVTVTYGDADGPASFTIVIPDTIELVKHEDGVINGTLNIELTDLKFNASKFYIPNIPNATYEKYQNLNISVTSANNAWVLKNELFANSEYSYTGTLVENTLYGFFAGQYDYNTTFKSGQYFYVFGNAYMISMYNDSLPYKADIHLNVDNPNSLPSIGEYKDTLTINIGFESVDIKA